MAHRFTKLVLASMLLANACSFDGSNADLGVGQDGGVGAVVDSGTTLGGLPDARPDGASLQGLPDASVGSDATLGGLPDAALPDAALPDAALPDAAPPDADPGAGDTGNGGG